MWTKRYQLKGKLLGHSDWVNKLLIYNENYLISGSDDKTIRVGVGISVLLLRFGIYPPKSVFSRLISIQRVCALSAQSARL